MTRVNANADYRPISTAEYLHAFEPHDDARQFAKLKMALQTAQDNRKFEIELYWRRAAYFWTFIAAALLAYGALATKGGSGPHYYGFEELFSGFGLTLSVAWFFVNRGSRFWQAHWEHQVDLLEDSIQGPLYKTVHFDKRNEQFKILGASAYSVSKVNQLVVITVSLLWLMLLLNSTAYVSPWVHALLIHRVAKTHTYDLLALAGLCLPCIASLCIWRFGRSRFRERAADETSGLMRRSL